MSKLFSLTSTHKITLKEGHNDIRKIKGVGESYPKKSTFIDNVDSKSFFEIISEIFVNYNKHRQANNLKNTKSAVANKGINKDIDYKLKLLSDFFPIKFSVNAYRLYNDIKKANKIVNVSNKVVRIFIERGILKGLEKGSEKLDKRLEEEKKPKIDKKINKWEIVAFFTAFEDFIRDSFLDVKERKGEVGEHIHRIGKIKVKIGDNKDNGILRSERVNNEFRDIMNDSNVIDVKGEVIKEQKDSGKLQHYDDIGKVDRKEEKVNKDLGKGEIFAKRVFIKEQSISDFGVSNESVFSTKKDFVIGKEGGVGAYGRAFNGVGDRLVSFIADEVRMNIGANRKSFFIRLHPPELGRVYIRIIMKGNKRMITRFLVEKKEVYDLLFNRLEHLKSELRGFGVALKGELMYIGGGGEGAIFGGSRNDSEDSRFSFMHTRASLRYSNNANTYSDNTEKEDRWEHLGLYGINLRI